eukprot:5404332-Amphidinium_carterae.3
MRSKYFVEVVVVEGGSHGFLYTPSQRLSKVTGVCCDIGWYLDVHGGAPRDLTIYLDCYEHKSAWS